MKRRPGSHAESAGRSSARRTALAALALAVACSEPRASRWPAERVRGVLIELADARDDNFAALAAAGTNVVAVVVGESTPGDALRRARDDAERAGLAFATWIEVARSPALADARPELMATLRADDPWRRHFPAFEAAEGELVRCYPWVPILGSAGYEAQLARVAAIVAALPAVDAILLDGLQGAPSACGCGNVLCRWAHDYRSGDETDAANPPRANAAADFVAAIARRARGARVVPVWVTECEEEDAAPTGACAGIDCYHGECWRAFYEQWAPLEERGATMAVLATHAAFGRGREWVRGAVGGLASRPHAGASAPKDVIAILQGWDVDDAAIRAQELAATAAGARGVMVALAPIESSFEPRK